MKYIFVDLFCGAGGVTTGIEQATGPDGEKLAHVIACVNHDEEAIASHRANHPESLHFTEDIRTLDLSGIRKAVEVARIMHPDAIVCLWASLECTNFSKAKGGLPKDADSRTLAEHLDRYVEAIEPEMIWIENVVEFQSWGPLDENGKPISKKNGTDFIRWVKHICSYGYNWDRRELNCADYGAYTSRIRLFMQFAKPHVHITWPKPTHSKKVESTSLISNNLKPWKPVREVLDFNDEGESIFNRKKPLCEKTLERIYAGLVKFIANGDESFLLKYNSMSQKGKYVPPSVDNPCPTIAVQGRLGVVKACFIQKHFSGRPAGKVIPVSGPAGSLTTTCNQSLVQCSFLTTFYNNWTNYPVSGPCPTIPTKDRFAMINVKHFIYRDFSKSGFAASIDKPAGTILQNPKLNLVTCKHYYLLNPQYQSKGNSIDKPCFTLIARMDKQPPYLIAAAQGGMQPYGISENDSESMRKIKIFMHAYRLSDIKMRMLRINELKMIQGFSSDYYLAGNQNNQKKFIGNSVPPPMVKALIEESALHNFSLLREYA